MGVGGNFWDLLKPYVRFEGVDFLRDKRVAVDLSFWIVQHDAAIRSRSPLARSPHLRLTFFRTLALFSRLGAFPVFVVDGDPSPLKDQARMERFLRVSGIDLAVLAKTPESGSGIAAQVAMKRNAVFSKWVQECVELLEILGMPVLKAQSEAEALCAQLNNEGHVDACITSDSDALLYGAKCVIKCLRSNSEECIIKEQRKRGNWQIKACKKIASEQNFPNKDIIDMFLNVNYQGSCDLSLKWHKPKVETLVDFLSFHQHWKPSYIRQQIFPVLSTIFLRELASTSEEGLLLYDQYKFHSIERVKIRHGHPCYLVKWKKAIHSLHNVTQNISDKELESEPTESFMTEDPMDTVDDLDIPTVIADDGSCFLTTEENMELVQAAFPKAVDDFLEEQVGSIHVVVLFYCSASHGQINTLHETMLSRTQTNTSTQYLGFVLL